MAPKGFEATWEDENDDWRVDLGVPDFQTKPYNIPIYEWLGILRASFSPSGKLRFVKENDHRNSWFTYL